MIVCFDSTYLRGYFKNLIYDDIIIVIWCYEVFMKFLKKWFFQFIFLVLIYSGSFAADWYVCLGSFKTLEKAEIYTQIFTEKGIDVKIAEADVNDEILYRVIYDVPCPTKPIARIVLENIPENRKFEGLNFSDYWICEAVPLNLEKELENNTEDIEFNNKINDGQASFEEKKEIVLTENQENLPINQENPYSVLVATYKEEQPANRDKKRLAEKNIDSYVVKTFDEENLFSFNLHSGAFENYEDAEDHLKKLEDVGIKIKNVSDYKLIEEKIASYNTEIEKQKISFETGETKLPKNFTPETVKVITQFPINKNYQIEGLSVIDYKQYNLMKSSINTSEVSKKSLTLLNKFDRNTYDKINASIEAISYAEYTDAILGKKTDIQIIACSDNVFSDLFESKLLECEENESVEKIDLKSNSLIWNSFYEQKENDYSLIGFDDSRKMFIRMICMDFSKDEFVDFLNNIENDGNLLIYPQVRKSISLLLDGNYADSSRFTSFTFEQVPKSYAASKGDAIWAKQIVGHWQSDVNYCYGDENDVLYISFFDMDYDFNARKVHNQFMEDHENSAISDSNHPVTIKSEKDGWYVTSFWGGFREVSFSKKSYIVAVDSLSDSVIEEENLIEISNELRIWE